MAKPTPKKKPAARMTVQVARCEVFCSEAMTCPLCHVLIPANTHHTCERRV